jgi:hypothetical protein
MASTVEVLANSISALNAGAETKRNARANKEIRTFFIFFSLKNNV